MAKVLITDELKAAIAAECRAQYPREACGLVVADNSGQHMVACANIAADAEHEFWIDPAKWQEVEDAGGEVVLVWHSHPNRRADLSPADRTGSEDVQVPYLVYGTPSDTWDYYEPNGWRAPLIGRPFMQGVLDCYSLVRDYHNDVFTIDLPNFYRPPNWWKQKGNDLIEANLEKSGFVRIPTCRKHAVIGMRLNHGPVNHLGIYLGNGMMLHHVYNKPSGHTPFTPGGLSSYAALADFYAIHKDVPDDVQQP